MAKATQETVDAAILSLQKNGKPVSYLTVRKFIGGGSHPLIMRLIKQSEYYDQTTSEGPQRFSIPRGEDVRIETEAKTKELVKQLELLLADRMEDAEQRGYTSRDDDFAALEAENAALVSELEQKSEALEACEQRVSSLQHDMGLKTAEIEGYKRDAENHKRELEALRVEMKRSEDDYKRIISECEKKVELAEQSVAEKWEIVKELLSNFGGKLVPETVSKMTQTDNTLKTDEKEYEEPPF